MARLALLMAIHRWAPSLSLLLAGIVLSLPVVGVSGAYHSGLRAIEDGVRGEFGYAEGWKIQASDEARAIVSGAPGVTAVEVGSAAFSTPAARVEGPFWTAGNADAPLGLIVAGRRATSSGEVTLSRHLAHTLRVRVGSVLTVRHDERDVSERIVGITVDPAHREADLAITVAPDSAGASSLEPTYWLVPQMSRLLDETPGVTASSVAGTTETRLEHLPGGLTALGRMTPVVAGLAVLSMMAAVVIQLASTRRDRDSLSATGMSLAAGWRVVLTWAGVLVACGAVIGVALAFVLLGGLAGPVSSALGQDWMAVVIPAGPSAAMVLLPVAIMLFPSRWLVGLINVLDRLGRAPRAAGRWGILVGAGFAVTGAAMVGIALLRAHGHLGGTHQELLGWSGSLLIVLGLFLAAVGIAGRRRRTPSARLVGNLVGRTAIGTAIALVVGVTGAMYTAWHTHNAYAYAEISAAPQESGSYLVYRAPVRAAEQVLARYRALGGEETVLYDLPNESVSLLRVTTPQMVNCLDSEPSASEALDRCYDAVVPTMNFPALDRSSAVDEVLAERAVVDAEGEVGLIQYQGSDATRIDRTATIKATVAPSLGGNMPGLVVSPKGQIAQLYGLRPSGLVELGLLDFSTLTAQDAAKIRALVASLAPAAQVSDASTDSSVETALALSATVALTTAALALLVQLVASVGAASATRPMRRAIGSIGIIRRRRVSVSMAAVAPALGALLVSGVLVRWIAPELGHPGAASVGWMWLVPLLGPGLIVVAQAWMSLRPARR